MEMYDVVIVGAGPAGLSAGIYALERKLKTIALESNVAGGQPYHLYPDKDIYDYPSYLKIRGKELATKITDHALQSGLKIIETTPVDQIKKSENNFLIKSQNQVFLAKSVILATGMGHYTARHLQVSGEEELKGRGVYYQKLPENIMGKRIAVIGGGDTALETAVSVAEKGGSVTIIHRREKFRALEKTIVKAKKLSIPIYFSSQVKSIQGTDKVEQVEIVKDNGSVTLLTVDMVIICVGIELNTKFLTNVGVKIEKQAAVVNENNQTSISGIFACGDVMMPLGKFRRISVATGTAAVAVNGVYQYLKNPYWQDK